MFPVILGANVNARIATVGSDIFSLKIDKVEPVVSNGSPAVPVNLNSFEVNGKLYQLELTFKLDSSLLFTLSLTAPRPGNFPGPSVPISRVTAGPVVLNIFAGTAESDFFTYKNVLYTFIKSESIYIVVQKSYNVYASHPATSQQQLAIFNM